VSKDSLTCVAEGLAPSMPIYTRDEVAGDEQVGFMFSVPGRPWACDEILPVYYAPKPWPAVPVPPAAAASSSHKRGRSVSSASSGES
jgi:hypothetical protein